MLNSFLYNKMIPHIEECYNNHIKPYFGSRPSFWKDAYNNWFSLTEDEKCTILEFVEKVQRKSIQKQMEKRSSAIPIPKIGVFYYSHVKQYKIENKEEFDSLSNEEKTRRCIEYHIKHKRRRPNAIKDGEKVSFKENASKR